MTEMALVSPLLVLLLSGSFTIGMSLTKTLVAGQLVRNANVLNVRGIDLSQVANQRALLRAAPGLGLNLPNTWNPDPNGKATVILTKVIRVGPNACNLGIPTWNQNPTSCPNYGQYVIASRVKIGNQTRWASDTGTPSSTPGTGGKISDANVATVTGNRASNFPGIITLSNDEFTLIAEVAADISSLNIFKLIPNPLIRVRNLS